MLTNYSVEIPQTFNKDDHHLDKIAALIQEAPNILIAAGAGISAAAGIDYTDTKKFTDMFPALVQKGFRKKYDVMGYEAWPPEAKWGYHTLNVHHDFYEIKEHPVYLQLLEIILDKNYFVITSNVDGMFYRNHFRADRIFTPQGNYSRIQCLTPCSQETWDIRPYLDKLLQSINPETQEISDRSCIPRCPSCGGEMTLNVRGGYWFVEKSYKQQEKNYMQWLKKAVQKKIVVLELGAGFNTPGVIRWPMEKIVSGHRNAHLMRVNLEYPEVPKEIADSSTALKSGIGPFIQAIYDRLKNFE